MMAWYFALANLLRSFLLLAFECGRGREEALESARVSWELHRDKQVGNSTVAAESPEQEIDSESEVNQI